MSVPLNTKQSRRKTHGPKNCVGRMSLTKNEFAFCTTNRVRAVLQLLPQKRPIGKRNLGARIVCGLSCPVSKVVWVNENASRTLKPRSKRLKGCGT